MHTKNSTLKGYVAPNNFNWYYISVLILALKCVIMYVLCITSAWELFQVYVGVVHSLLLGICNIVFTCK